MLKRWACPIFPKKTLEDLEGSPVSMDGKLGTGFECESHSVGHVEYLNICIAQLDVFKQPHEPLCRV